MYRYRLGLAFMGFPAWFTDDYQRLSVVSTNLGHDQTQKWLTHSYSVSRKLMFKNLRASTASGKGSGRS